MIVRADGSIFGTVGGGLLEARVQKSAKDVLVDRKARVMDFNLSASDAGQMDMICGGYLEVLVDYIDANNSNNLSIYRELTKAVVARQRTVLLTAIPGGEGACKQCLVYSDGTMLGEFDYPSSWLGDHKPHTGHATAEYFQYRPGLRLFEYYQPG